MTTTTDERKQMSTFSGIVRTIAIFIPIVAALPAAMDLYTAIDTDQPFWEVRWRAQQARIMERNWGCQPRMKYVRLGSPPAAGKSIVGSACEDHGDIHIRLQEASAVGRPSQLWISYNELAADRRGFRWLDIIKGSSSAHAAEPDKRSSDARAPLSGLRYAQAADFKVMCTAWVKRDQVVQVVKDGSQCFKEDVSPYGGKIRKREPVACTVKCPESTYKRTG